MFFIIDCVLDVWHDKKKRADSRPISLNIKLTVRLRLRSLEEPENSLRIVLPAIDIQTRRLNP